MKRRLFLAVMPALALLLSGCMSLSAQPKRALLVTTTSGFRHSSIETAEQIIGQIAKDTGAFTIVAQASVTPPRDPGRNATPEQRAAFAEARTAYDASVKAALAETMSPAALKNYDVIIFANTTGNLPLPDRDAFIQWVRDGGAFVGMHSATDTLTGFPAYVEMINGAFNYHREQVVVDTINKDKEHPANKHLGETWDLQGKKEEIYVFKSYMQKAVRELLVLDKHPNTREPGHYPVSWCRDFGQGKVFYTSLGHNEYVWEMPEFQKHILGGIRWATGLEKGSATPQAK